MPSQRKRHKVEFKTKVALAVICQDKTTNELTTEYGVHATQIPSWKKQALSMIPHTLLLACGMQVSRMGEDVHWTTFLSSASGAPSTMSSFFFTIFRAYGR